jgi:hypothetical protein
MKKIVLLLLTALLLAGCSAAPAEAEAKRFTADGAQVREIRLDLRDRRIDVVPSPDGQIHIEYVETDKERCEIALAEDQVLAMTAAQDKSFTDYVGAKPAAALRTVTLKLPDQAFARLTLSTTNEAVSFAAQAEIETLSLSSNGGDLLFENLAVGRALTLWAKNGGITGTILGSYGDFSISCASKKGESNLPAAKEGGEKTLNVTCNNGNVDIRFVN